MTNPEAYESLRRAVAARAQQIEKLRRQLDALAQNRQLPSDA